MTKACSILVVTFLASTVTSCMIVGDDHTLFIPPTQQEMWDCYQQRDWDEQVIQAAMLGQWQWVYSVSAWSAEGRNMEREHTFLEVYSDSLTVKGRNTHFTRNWTLTEAGDTYKIDTEDFIDLLHGPILICENILSFNSSWRDGTDNYFERR